jgi:hypothetical protein
MVLTRHCELGSERRIVKLGRSSPQGFVLERDLGAIQRYAPPGTVRLVRNGDHFSTIERGAIRSDDDEELGHLETAPLPLLQTVERAFLADGSETLVNGEGDALRDSARQTEFLGFIEAFPNQPFWPPDCRRSSHGVSGLLRCISRTTRRHVYCVGAPEPDTELVAELGAVYLTGEPGMIPLYLDGEVGVSVENRTFGVDSASLLTILRWTVAPVGWRGFGRVKGRLRSVARRAYEAPMIWARGADRVSERGASTLPGQRVPAGYLLDRPGPDRRELFAALHPVTDDRLLTCHPLEAADMGYSAAVSLGYVLNVATVTGSLETRRVPVPWASRFGLDVRRS